MKKGLALLVCILSLALLLPSASAAEVLIADFDSGSKPNNIGSDFGAWDRDPNDTTQACYDSMIKDGAYGGKGYSLKLEYDVESPNPAYNGFWTKLGGIDIGSYKYITFYAKGDKDAGFTNQFKVELKNATEVGRYLVKGITSEWKKISIPLENFQGITYLTGMQEFVIVFDDINSNPKTGTLYLDNIAFSN